MRIFARRSAKFLCSGERAHPALDKVLRVDAANPIERSKQPIAPTWIRFLSATMATDARTGAKRLEDCPAGPNQRRIMALLTHCRQTQVIMAGFSGHSGSTTGGNDVLPQNQTTLWGSANGRLNKNFAQRALRSWTHVGNAAGVDTEIDH